VLELGMSLILDVFGGFLWMLSIGIASYVSSKSSGD
jgi:hypothetical protein